MDRRTFIGASGAAACTLLAGCLSSTDEQGGSTDGSGARNGTDGETHGSESTRLGSYAPIARWTVPPEDPDDYYGGFVVRATSPSTLLDAVADGSTGYTEYARQTTDYYWGDPEPETIDWNVLVESDGILNERYSVVLGSFEKADVRERIEAHAERTETYGAFDVYGGVSERPFHDRNHVFAVGDGVVVQSGGRVLTDYDGSYDDVQRIVEARRSADPSAVVAYEGVRTVASRLNPEMDCMLRRQHPGQETDVERGAFSGATARGFSATYDGATARKVEIFAFEDADAVPSDALEEYVDTKQSSEDGEGVTHRVDGGVVEVEDTVPAKNLLLL